MVVFFFLKNNNEQIQLDEENKVHLEYCKQAAPLIWHCKFFKAIPGAIYL